MYALLLVLVGLPPLILALSRWKFGWSKQDWLQLGKSYLCVSVPFVLLDAFSHARGWWHYNPAYVSDLTLLGLPIEEVLFFFVIPFACLYLYSAMDRQFKKAPVSKYFGWGSVALLLASLAVVSFFSPYERTIVDAVLLLAVLITWWAIRPRFTRPFVYWSVSIMLLFFTVNTALTALPIVEYGPEFGSQIRIGTVPFEDAWYNLSLLLGSWLFWAKAGRYPKPTADRLASDRQSS